VPALPRPLPRLKNERAASGRSARSLCFGEGLWCCQTGLNCRPLHYQWSALPLSYGSMPGYENRPKRAPPRRPILATRPPHAQAHGRPPGSSKCGKNQRGTPATASIGSVAGRSGSRFPRPAPPAPRRAGHDLEFDDFAGVTPLSCHLPILAAADRMLAPRNRRLHQWRAKHDIFGQWRGQQVMVARGDKAMPDIPRPLRQSSQWMHFAHRVFAPVIRTGSR
jgi:hypothetical protein